VSGSWFVLAHHERFFQNDPPPKLVRIPALGHCLSNLGRIFMNSIAVCLAQRPVGLPGPECFTLREAPLPTPGEGEVLVAVYFISIDPAMRGWMNEGKSYIPPVQLGDVMRALAVGEVVESRAPGFAAGDWVRGAFGVQSHCAVPAKGLSKIDPVLAPPARWLGGLGMPGMTAYFGLLDVCAHREGDIVLVSAANGAVGSVVGQLAKARGSKVIGVAGGPEKCRHVVETYGFDACIDYKAHNGDTRSLAKALKDACPDGIDGYFENVGGWIMDAVMLRMNAFGRIAVCGMIAGYDGAPLAMANPALILINRMKVEGFIVGEHMEVWPEALKELGQLVGSGTLRPRESVAQGLAAAPEAFLGMLKGKNFGKQLVKLV